MSRSGARSGTLNAKHPEPHRGPTILLATLVRPGCDGPMVPVRDRPIASDDAQVRRHP